MRNEDLYLHVSQKIYSLVSLVCFVVKIQPRQDQWSSWDEVQLFPLDLSLQRAR